LFIIETTYNKQISTLTKIKKIVGGAGERHSKKYMNYLNLQFIHMPKVYYH